MIRLFGQIYYVSSFNINLFDNCASSSSGKRIKIPSSSSSGGHYGRRNDGQPASTMVDTKYQQKFDDRIGVAPAHASAAISPAKHVIQKRQTSVSSLLNRFRSGTVPSSLSPGSDLAESLGDQAHWRAIEEYEEPAFLDDDDKRKGRRNNADNPNNNNNRNKNKQNQREQNNRQRNRFRQQQGPGGKI
jgi:hypothetical protein